MAPSKRPTNPTQPLLGQLFEDFLRHQATALQSGLALPPADGEVVPHDAGAVQTTDPRLAWEGALTAGRYFGAAKPLAASVPADWGALVGQTVPRNALPFCLGKYPQQVRDLSGLMKAGTFEDEAPGRASCPAGVLAWAEGASWQKGSVNPLLAAAVLRLAGQFDAAHALLQEHEATLPEAWRAAHANEKAALAWHRGDHAGAESQWLAQPESVPVLFNRGLAALVRGDKLAATAALARAVEQLPESDGWHHLARLYLALAQQPS
jgi:hypothetical protein